MLYSDDSNEHLEAQTEAYLRMVERTGKNPDALELEIRKRKHSMFVSGLKKYGNLKDICMLDIGCFDGSLLNKCREGFSSMKNNLVFVGVDITYSCCRETNLKGLNSVQASAEKGLPFKDNSFDIVYSSEVIEHCLDTFNFLGEINRILKDNGIVFLTTPNINSIRNRWRVLLGEYPYGIETHFSKYLPGHVRAFNFYTLEHLLEKFEFKVLEKNALNILPIRFSMKKMLKCVDVLLCKKIYTLGANMVILAKKKKNISKNSCEP